MLACPPVDVRSTITSLSGPLLPIPSPRILHALDSDADVGVNAVVGLEAETDIEAVVDEDENAFDGAHATVDERA